MEGAHSHSHAGHDHSHHGHSHGQVIALRSVNSAFVIGIILNLAFVIIEVVVGLGDQIRLSLLSDAGHNLADVGESWIISFCISHDESEIKYGFLPMAIKRPPYWSLC